MDSLTLRCKPGDMAIVRYAHTPVVGKVVEVIERSDDVMGMPAWRVQFRGAAKVRNKETGQLTLGCDADCPDSWLRPISGVPVGEDVRDEVTACPPKK